MLVLKSGISSYRANGIQYFLMAGVNVANLPMTTTYTMDVGGDTQHPTTGSLAWVDNITEPVLDQSDNMMGVTLQNGGNIVFLDSPTESVTDYSDVTGAMLWTDTPFTNFFESQTLNNAGPVAYGMCYDAGFDGYVHAINVTTGVQEWESPTTPGGLESQLPYQTANGIFIAGNTVFTATTMVYEAEPSYRGHALFAYNAQTGAQIWNVSGEYSINAIADGILLAQNNYDSEEYAFEAGPSATTVTAPMTSITAGSPVIIQGTVTDQTPGILKGTPAISDTWMSAWMEYMYMDQPLPTQATGVNVVITAIDPNHNYITIGNATSDTSGSYHYTWTPPNISGTYTIIATFNADNSYYGSSAETATVVTSAASATSAPTASPTSVADTYFMPAIAGLFVLIIVVAIVLALLMLRKRP
jgi:hypothetical protein